MVEQTLAGFWRELKELGTNPVQTRQGIVAAVSVTLSTTLALALQLDAPWWVAISGFMSLMSTGAASLRRGLLRLTGTIAGAVLGFIMARWLPHDHLALCLFLALTTAFGVIAMQVTSAWACLALYVDHVEPGTAVEPERPDAGLSARCLSRDRRGGRRRLRHCRRQCSAGLACRSSAHGAGMAPSAGRAMAGSCCMASDRQLLSSPCWRSGS